MSRLSDHDKTNLLYEVNTMLGLCSEMSNKLDAWFDQNPGLANVYLSKRIEIRRQETYWIEELRMIIDDVPSITPPTKPEVDALIASTKKLSNRVAASAAWSELLDVIADAIRLFGEVRDQAA